mmetsp:Transcript_11363/g.27967  ORF Transcript_11363/g.27967 Transcript_11363/m.27967 type:complete len:389 (+) Transcript_11363:93-1259(+)|eukprot:CAMPEP_0114521770 /NCGR_PEP_ID=MMETSP0109-20121206/20367_1 /TAXON_ID=29199 /ORGANISM="Chlorarachnion reptans, Strain CCCM449" /LENGTH=388 /DNA_ID=CAMNT_0001702905 /DNA_START=16 /DNA_END=1182 /DNA_ORIENTATION=+
MADSFDSLMFQGLRTGTGSEIPRERYCRMCRTTTAPDESKGNVCGECGHEYSFLNGERKSDNRGNSDSGTGEAVGHPSIANMFRFLPVQGILPRIISNGAAGEMGLDPLQRAINISLAEARNKTAPTTKTFIDNLEDVQLSKAHFVPVVLRVKELKADIRCCRARFGSLKIEEGEGQTKGLKDETKRIIAEASVIPAEPIHGESELENALELKGSICIMKRGKVSFITKARKAESAGCLGLVVIQSEDGGWPYHMTDSTNSKPEVKMPVVMVSHSDGNTLLKAIAAIRGQSKDSKKGEVKDSGCLFSIGVQPSCPICREDFKLCSSDGDDKATELPCGHLFHLSCLRPWLEKQSVCPMCRFQLPSKKQKGNIALLAEHLDQRRAEMYQ